MSIHVTVSGNPVYYDRGKLLLTDIETLKKNEWMRRRRIRLQQARQQAKDHSYNVRQKVSSEESSIEKKEHEKQAASQSKRKIEQIKNLEEELEENLSNVGSGHHLASLQAECEALLREKQQLWDEIARARGAIAEEKLKAEKCLQKEKANLSVGRKQLARKVENLRSTLITQLPANRPPVSSGPKTVKVQVHRGTTKDASSSSSQGPSGKSLPRETLNARPTTSRGSIRKEGSVSEGEESGSDDDSDVTWPPRSARVVKEPIPSPRVRFYDHNTRVAKECPKPPYTVTPADPLSQPNMSTEIAQEEEDVVRKENLEVLARRENLIRGNKALRKERDKKDAEILLKEIDELEKRRKVQVALSKSYPSKIHARDDSFEECENSVNNPFVQGDDDEYEAATVRKEELLHKGIPPSHAHMSNVTSRECAPQGSHLIQPVSKPGTEELLEELIDKLKEERARKAKQLEKRFKIEGLKESDVPVWVPLERTPQNTDHANLQRWEKILGGNIEVHNHPTEKGRRSPRRLSAEENSNREKEKFSPDRPGRHSLPSDLSQMSPERRQSADTERNQNKRSPSPCDTKSPGGRRKQVKQKLEISNKCTCCDKCDCSVDIPIQLSHSGEGNSPVVEGKSPKEESRRNSFDERKHTSTPKKPPSQETISSTDSSIPPETIKSCLTYEGVKVVVKVSDRNKKVASLSPVKTCTTDKDVQTSAQESSSKSVSWNNEFVSSSTSYRSLPSKITSEQQSLLHTLLRRIDARNKNPRLHAYINQLLSMTRESIDNLPVSSVSEVSVGSSLFDLDQKENQPVQFVNHDQVDHVTNDEEINLKYDASCQVDNSVNEQYQEEVMKFSELAKGYANRVEDLAGMLEGMNLLPCRKAREPEDTTYMSLPEEIQVSVKLPASVKPGQYPKPLDLSDIPTSIYPRPDEYPQLPTHHHQLNGFQRFPNNARTHGLSTIQEVDSQADVGRACTPNMFDPNVSSIKGTPEKGKAARGGEADDSAASSLCLLDERELGSSFFGSSSDDFEDVFRSLGIAWALPTVRKVREAQRQANSSSSSGGKAHYSHSTPLVRSPARGSARTSPGKSSSKPSSRLPDSDSLTPPAYSLNIPRLSANSPRHSPPNRSLSTYRSS